MKGINGLILSGGKSSRMGIDKGTISFHGKPQYDFLYELLSRYCDLVFISCKDSLSVATSLPKLPDLFILESPLNGILSAFAHTPDVAWLTLPVDMPMISEKTIETLLAGRNNAGDATCFADSEGKFPEPLVALWEPRAANKLKSFFEDGNISPRIFLISNQTRIIAPPDRNFHLNINTPEDLATFRKGNGLTATN